MYILYLHFIFIEILIKTHTKNLSIIIIYFEVAGDERPIFIIIQLFLNN